MNKLVAFVAASAAALAFSACEVEEAGTSNADDNSSGTTTGSKVSQTVAQKNATAAAKNYLALDSGFSRYGLIQQLTSKAGSGFKRPDAVYAVNHLKINWNEQAVLAAKHYLDLGTGFSRDGLIQQLSSRSGSGFTRQQAVYAADKVGL